MSSEFRAGIGGTDIPAIVGIDKYRGPLDVYARIVEGKETEDKEAFLRGRLMEPVIRELYQYRTGAALKGPRKIRDGWVRANLDDVAIRDGVERVAEFKSANIRVAHEWGDGDDDVPPSYLLQCQWYMHWARIPFCDLAVFLGGADLHVYELRADLDLQSMLIEAAERFWRDHVETKTPPPVDGSWSSSEWLRARFPVERGPVMVADTQDEEIARRLFAAREAKAAAEREEYAARNALIMRIGDAAGIEGQGWRVSYKQTKGKPSTDWEAVCAEAGVPKELIEKHTKRSPFRMFRPTETKR
jgi:putative phage-type endonuclease